MTGATRTVAVLGGTGKTGRAVCAALTDRGAVARPLSRRHREHLPAALAGCDAAYVIAPNMHPDEPGLVAEACAALVVTGVGRVVYHSVAAPYAPSMPHHVGKAVAEDVVRRSGLAWTVLQPAPYLQNLDLTRTVRVPYRADAQFGFLDLADLGRAAATVLLDDGHVGATYELASRQATVAVLAAEAGVGVEVVGAGEWAVREGADLEPRVREWLLAMFAHYDAHGLPVGTRVLEWLLRS
ncbi:SDR family oxidoreductase [Nocardioides sp. SYSU D00038]|uniref:SDR family oxidoreductase n=1 Tax=Nocardioides sp. SYSU D00038 TaxID=2812554 RepID=UPI0019676950|nr:NAD(P)H-binding protein [Nocardioides sp. SYSU D00038]